MLVFKIENDERKTKKTEKYEDQYNITLLLDTCKQRNTVSVSPLKPGPLLPRRSSSRYTHAASFREKKCKALLLQAHGDAISSVTAHLPGASWLHCPGFKWIF